VNTLDYIVNTWKINTALVPPIWMPFISRVDLAIMFNLLEFKQIAEIGVYRGDYSYTLCKQNPQAQIYCIDAWVPYQDGDTYRQHQENKHYAEKRLGIFTNGNIIQSDSMDALDRFADNSLDAVYIDANHDLPHATNDIYYWSKKVRSGGIVSGHDYIQPPKVVDGCHVREATEAYTRIYEIDPWFVIGSEGRALSWLWVKP